VLFVGLTGGIGSGKSEALASCRRHGAAVISSDDIVHELLATNEVRDLLVGRWGERVLAGGQVDREAVAAIVFERPDELQWLEGVLFPRVGERIARWRAQLEQKVGGPQVAVVEVPLLFEAGIEGFFDATVAVVTDEETRNQRAGERAHLGLRSRTARQLSQEEKADRADYVIRNDGTLDDLDASVAKVLQKLGPGAGA
jgi:dephospho-CoA kinase